MCGLVQVTCAHKNTKIQWLIALLLRIYIGSHMLISTKMTFRSLSNLFQMKFFRDKKTVFCLSFFRSLSLSLNIYPSIRSKSFASKAFIEKWMVDATTIINSNHFYLLITLLIKAEKFPKQCSSGRTRMKETKCTDTDCEWKNTPYAYAQTLTFYYLWTFFFVYISTP